MSETKGLNDWVREIHEYAKAKGWWDKPRSALEIQMLCVTELAEATEEVRNGKPDVYQNDLNGAPPRLIVPGSPFWNPEGKPEGEAIELVDCLIRLMDYFGHKGWDLEQLVEMKHAYNQKRPYRHGGKLC